MVEVLKRLLDREKYSIIEGKGYIRIHDYIPDTNMEDQEVFIQVEFTDNIYAVYKVSRGIKSLEMQSEDKTYFIAYTYLYIDKLYSDKSYIRTPDSKIFFLLLENKVEEARKLLEENLNHKYASINKIERDKVSLIKRKKGSAVIYNEITIKDNMEFQEGFGTLLRFSKYLERFEILFNKLKESLPVDKYYDKLLNFI